MAAVVGAFAVILVAPMVGAEVTGPVAGVVHGDRLSPKVGDDGQARVIPMQRGEWAYMGEFHLEPGTTLQPEVRTDEEYLYIISGSAVLTADDRRFLVGPRMGVYLPTGADVTWTNGPDDLIGVQFLAGASPGGDYEEWEVEESDQDWPRPRIRPRPEPSEISVW